MGFEIKRIGETVQVLKQSDEKPKEKLNSLPLDVMGLIYAYLHTPEINTLRLVDTELYLSSFELIKNKQICLLKNIAKVVTDTIESTHLDTLIPPESKAAIYFKKNSLFKEM